jgi:uncharacterized protein YcbK (DUF882 family)
MAKYTFFEEREFECRCDNEECTCEDLEMDAELMGKLDELRKRFGVPLSPTSGKRCAAHNKAIGGSPRSQHLLGKAADFYLINACELNRLYDIAEEIGFGGIGKGKHLLHVDTRKGHARWYYD